MTISFKSFLEDFFRAAFSKISSLYYLRLSGNVLIGLLGGHSCGTFQTNPIINRRFITRESSSKAVKAVNCYSYHLLKVDPSGSVTRVIEAECRQRAENKKPNRRRPTNERSSFDTEAFFLSTKLNANDPTIFCKNTFVNSTLFLLHYKNQNHCFTNFEIFCRKIVNLKGDLRGLARMLTNFRGIFFFILEIIC